MLLFLKHNTFSKMSLDSFWFSFSTFAAASFDFMSFLRRLSHFFGTPLLFFFFVLKGKYLKLILTDSMLHNFMLFPTGVVPATLVRKDEQYFEEPFSDAINKAY